MGETAHILSVVVVSPGDVQAERDCLPAVIEEVNRDIARDQGLRLELKRWETDTYPGVHPAGPQDLIDPLLRVEDCDVLTGDFYCLMAWTKCQRPTSAACRSRRLSNSS